VALIGPAVPDLRGMFLRGAGGNAAALGSVQGDAIRNITGQTELTRVHVFTGEGGSGALRHNISGSAQNLSHSGSNPLALRLTFDASRVVPTANENRPVNMAVRYLIRAAN